MRQTVGLANHVADDWAHRLRQLGLVNFSDFWHVAGDEWGEPNHGRGGWSGVTRVHLNGVKARIFVKRQENHTYRSIAALGMRRSTCAREFANLLRFQRFGIPSLRPIYFGEQLVGDKLRAILVTAELVDYRSLEELAHDWQCDRSTFSEKRQIIRAVAEVIGRMHDARLQHNCLYPKHILIKRETEAEVDVRLIDLEKARRRVNRKAAILRDLDTLNRRAAGLSRTDRLRFLLAYCATERINDTVRELWRRLAEKRC
jgi:tRNA A-37 threonylcarbamoyl transferase component Bud32